MRSDEGAADFAAVVSELLTTTFGAARRGAAAKPLNAAAGRTNEFPWAA